MVTRQQSKGVPIKCGYCHIKRKKGKKNEPSLHWGYLACVI